MEGLVQFYFFSSRIGWPTRTLLSSCVCVKSWTRVWNWFLVFNSALARNMIVFSKPHLICSHLFVYTWVPLWFWTRVRTCASAGIEKQEGSYGVLSRVLENVTTEWSASLLQPTRRAATTRKRNVDVESCGGNLQPRRCPSDATSSAASTSFFRQMRFRRQKGVAGAALRSSCGSICKHWLPSLRHGKSRILDHRRQDLLFAGVKGIQGVSQACSSPLEVFSRIISTGRRPSLEILRPSAKTERIADCSLASRTPTHPDKSHGPRSPSAVQQSTGQQIMLYSCIAGVRQKTTWFGLNWLHYPYYLTSSGALELHSSP